jgi:ComEC/Rec2-related protein
MKETYNLFSLSYFSFFIIGFLIIEQFSLKIISIEFFEVLIFIYFFFKLLTNSNLFLVADKTKIKFPFLYFNYQKIFILKKIIESFFYKKYYLFFLLGAISGYGLINVESIKNKEFIDQLLPIDVYEANKINKESYEIDLETEIKRNFYKSKIKIKNQSFNLILNSFEKKIEYKKFICSFDSLKKIEIDSKNEYLSFIPIANNYYFKWNYSKCTPISESIFYYKKIYNFFQIIIERGNLGKEPEGVAKAIIFGDANYLQKDFKEKAREGGIMHLFAASGLHMGILIAFFYLILKKIPFLNYYSVNILPILISFVYLFTLDFPVSLSRAYLFAVFVLLGNILFRKLNKINLLLYSIFFVRILLPKDYLSLSFLLSYGAVIGIFFLYPVFKKSLFNNINNLIIDNVCISLSASLGTFPFLLIYFSSFSLGSILINLFVLPLASILLPILYLSIFFELIRIPFLNDLMWILSEILIRLLLRTSIFFSSAIGYFREFKTNKNSILICYVILIFIILFLYFINYTIEMKNKNSKWILIFRPINFLALIVFFYYLDYTSDALKIDPKPKKYAGIDFYVFKKERHLFLGGSCKYNHFILSKIRKNDDCKFIQEIHISDINCIEFALSCSDNIKFYYQGKIKEIDFLRLFPEIKIVNDKIPRIFFEEETFIIFKPGVDSLWGLIQSTKTGKGVVLLQFPYKSRDTSKEWNQNKKILGISTDWRFVTHDELNN